VTEREKLARIIDPEAFEMLNANMPADEQAFIRQLQNEALAKADQWLSRPSPVDGLKASLDEATSATMMAEMRADKLMAENARLREVVAELERQMEHTFPIEWVDVPRKPKFPPTSQET
jgi:hypothetical protein